MHGSLTEVTLPVCIVSVCVCVCVCVCVLITVTCTCIHTYTSGVSLFNDLCGPWKPRKVTDAQSDMESAIIPGGHILIFRYVRCDAVKRQWDDFVQLA